MTSSLPIDARASMLQASEELRQLETRGEQRFAAVAVVALDVLLI